MVRIPELQEWYPKVGSSQTGAHDSLPPTYPVHVIPKSNVSLQ